MLYLTVHLDLNLFDLTSTELIITGKTKAEACELLKSDYITHKLDKVQAHVLSKNLSTNINAKEQFIVKFNRGDQLLLAQIDIYRLILQGRIGANDVVDNDIKFYLITIK